MKTMYALAVDYDPSDDPGDIFLLGWSNEEDYYTTSRTVYDILGLEPVGSVIDAGYGVGVYADRNLKFVEDEVEPAKQEDFNVTVIRIDETDDEFDVTPVL